MTFTERSQTCQDFNAPAEEQINFSTLISAPIVKLYIPALIMGQGYKLAYDKLFKTPSPYSVLNSRAAGILSMALRFGPDQGIGSGGNRESGQA